MAQVPAVARALKVLELMAGQASPLTLSQISSLAAIPTASCHAILNTLEANGYAARTVIGRSHYWEPTLALYHLGALVVARLGVGDVALPHLRALAEKVGCPAHVGVLEGPDVIYIAKAPAPVFIQFDTYPGKTSPFHLTALGRAIAAFEDDVARAQLLKGLPRRYGRVLDETRERGYAVEDGEDVAGVGCIAAPLRDATGTVSASLGITGFSTELFGQDRDRVVSAVAEAAGAVSQALGYAAPPAAAVTG